MNSINQLQLVLKTFFNYDNSGVNYDTVQVSLVENSNANKVTWKKSTNQLIINIAKLDGLQTKALKEVVQSYINDDNGILLQRESKSLLDRIFEYHKTNGDDIESLACINGAIPNLDYQALEASYFIRAEMNSGSKKVPALKKDILERYGKRGGDIANLCTSGYFDELIIPLVANLKKEDFQKEYEKIVGLGTQALFIHNRMSKKLIINEIDRKITLAQRYGLKSFHIHCRGEANIALIDSVLKEYQEENGMLKKKSRTVKKLAIKIIDVILK